MIWVGALAVAVILLAGLAAVWQGVGRTRTTLSRMDLRPGQHILEIGPGSGRLLLPAAAAIQPGGVALGVDLVPGRIARLQRAAALQGLDNVTGIVGNATQAHVPDGSMDLVFLRAALGEIADRPATLLQCFRALKPGGRLSITELFGDPHYLSLKKVERLARDAGFRLEKVHGRWWFFTANFIKPTER